MKRIRRFKTHAEYEAYIANVDYPCPNVSYCNDTLYEVHYNGCPPRDYSKDYFTFMALENGTFKLSGNSVNYSIDNGKTWRYLESETDSPTVTAGNKILWRASLTPQSNKGIGTFSSSGRFKAEGNPMSLLYSSNFTGWTSLDGKDNAFARLFWAATGLTSAENLVLLATKLGKSSYAYMFYGCTSLTKVPPVLPATALTYSCYYGMFWGCTSLTTAPVLPATRLSDNICCYGMFADCASLTSAPELLPITLTDSCYRGMFSGCTSLKETPVLSATTMAKSCYADMFKGCTSLTTASELPAIQLGIGCYSNMFQGCTSLVTPPSELKATILQQACYYCMFNGCTSLTTAPVLPAGNLNTNCYAYMFGGCTNLNYVKCLASSASPSNALTNWLSGVAPNGTFVKRASMTSWPTGASGIPSGWTVENAT